MGAVSFLFPSANGLKLLGDSESDLEAILLLARELLECWLDTLAAMLGLSRIHMVLHYAESIKTMNKGFAVSRGSFPHFFVVLNRAFFLGLLRADIFASVSKWPDFWPVGTHLAHKYRLH